MTQDEIKKGLEYAAKVTGNGVFAGAYKIITEQEIEIERLKAEKKQAQIDVLNKLKIVERQPIVIAIHILNV